MKRNYPKHRKSPDLTPEQRAALGRRWGSAAHSLADEPEFRRRRIAKIGGHMRWYDTTDDERKDAMALVRASQQANGGRS
jgi:hypothetical protein